MSLKIPTFITIPFSEFPNDHSAESYIRVATLEPRVQALLKLDMRTLNRILENALQQPDLEFLHDDIEQCMDQIAAVPEP